MKKFFFLLVAALLIGFVSFAIMYWVLKMNYQQSLTLAVVVAFTGIVIEYIKPILTKKHQKY